MGRAKYYGASDVDFICKAKSINIFHDSDRRCRNLVLVGVLKAADSITSAVGTYRRSPNDKHVIKVRLASAPKWPRFRTVLDDELMMWPGMTF